MDIVSTYDFHGSLSWCFNDFTPLARVSASASCLLRS